MDRFNYTAEELETQQLSNETFIRFTRTALFGQTFEIKKKNQFGWEEELYQTVEKFIPVLVFPSWEFQIVCQSEQFVQAEHQKCLTAMQFKHLSLVQKIRARQLKEDRFTLFGHPVYSKQLYDDCRDLKIQSFMTRYSTNSYPAILEIREETQRCLTVVATFEYWANLMSSEQGTREDEAEEILAALFGVLQEINEESYDKWRNETRETSQCLLELAYESHNQEDR